VVQSIAFIGCQNGDEGKGKIVEYISSLMEEKTETSQKQILTYRWQGGPNAGHTVVKDNIKFKLHQLPSGLIRNTTYNLLGKGMLINPRKLLEEIHTLTSQGIQVTKENLGISSKAHMILDYHVNADQKHFNLAEHTSTGNGIKQAARDKANRIGIRFIEFLDKDLMINILNTQVFPQGMQDINIEEFANSYEKERETLKHFLALESEVFNNQKFKYWLGEGAQGFLLDLDDGQYPGITSTCPCQPTHRPNKLVGIFKSYVSSVGIGDRPFVAEMNKELQPSLVKEWGEFGTTTGKPRHIGWFDTLAGKHAIETSHIDHIGITCLDRLEALSKINQKPKIVIGYEIDGITYDKWDVSFNKRDTLKKAKPIIQEFDSWEKTTEEDNKTLTPNAQKYLEFIENKLGKKFSFIGIGPSHEQIIIREDILN
jgi:adenylosuccinate synthase